MAVADRTVRQLRLRAASAAQARRGALCIEDALRCASLPGAGAPLLLVRRLALGRIDANGASQPVALRIEQALRGFAAQWRHGELDDAADAQAVWFADRPQALAALVQRLAERRPVTAWYWRRLLPADLQPPASAPTLRLALLALLREPGAAALLPALIDTLQQRGAAAPLHAVLAAGDVAALRRAAGVALPGDAAVMPPPPSAPAAATARASRPVAPAPADALQHGGRPETAAPAAPSRAPADRRAHVATAPPPRPPVGGAASPDAGSTLPAPQPQQPPPTAAPFDLTLPTAAGGLACLLPVLARLGFVTWFDAEPVLRASVARRVLQQALQRLPVPDDDPAWALCAAPPDGAADADAARWLLDARHALRRRWRIGLASLVLRQARLAWTRSHVDVHFALADTDLRLRRHGLDLDPGWLPWFGRVVAFHFERR